MKTTLKHLGIWLLLLMAQQGAAVHELGHLVGFSDRAGAQIDTGARQESTCALCPSYSLAASAALGHTLQIPSLIPGAVERSADLTDSAVVTRLLAPRNRGPPSET